MKLSRLSRWTIIVCTPFVGALSLFPFFGRARDDARRSSCRNNLKQMGLAIAQYSQDYGGFPLAVVGGIKIATTKSGGLPGTPVGWADALEVYTKSR